MSSSALRSIAHQARVRYARSGGAMDVQPGGPDSWLAPSGGAARHSSAGLHGARHDNVGSDANPLRRSASAPTIAADPLGGGAIPPDVLTALRRSTGTGSALPATVAASTGDALGADLSAVRMHTDGSADRLARSVQAEAFTHGRDIYFSQGTYAPHSADGSRLLAHELAHVAAGTSSGASGTVGRADDPSEAAADRVAQTIAPALRRSWNDRPAQAPSPHTDVSPDLASDAAVQRSVLRRRISATSADIAATRPKKKGLTKLTGGKDSLDKIGKLLDRHPGLKDQQAQVINLTAIVTLVDKWLDAHAGDKDRAMVALLEDVKAEARRDLGQAQAQLRYVNDLRAGEGLSSKDQRQEHQPTATPITQQLTEKMATKASWAMGYAEKEWRDTDPRKKVADLIRDTGLTEAEVAAIKLFTANDYLYLNPAVANSDSWLQGQMKEIGGLSEKMADYAGPRTADPAAMKQEGATHAGVLMQALAKLEVKKGLVYRGARMSQQEFDAAYGSQSQLTYTSFVSSSTRESPAANYAAGGGTKRPRADQTVSVKCIFEVDDARDVKVLSEIPSEEEWLLMPGATFTITRIEDEANGVPGSPPATAWKIVHLKQIKQPLYQAKPAAADAAKPGSPPDLSSPAAQALAKLGRGDFSAPGKQPAAPAGPSSAEAMQRLGRRDFSTGSRRRRP